MSDVKYILFTLTTCLIGIGVMTLLIYIFARLIVDRVVNCNHLWCPIDFVEDGWGVTCYHCSMEIASGLTEDAATTKARFLNGENPTWREYPTDFPDAEWDKGKKE